MGLDERGCPCGSGATLGACCGPLLDGHPAATAEALMRSRYTAFALAGVHPASSDHLWRTWHPSTRPEDVRAEPGQQWLGLSILDVVDGGPDDQTGEVTFEARWRQGRTQGVMHERSTFVRRGGRWTYLDGVLD